MSLRFTLAGLASMTRNLTWAFFHQGRFEQLGMRLQCTSGVWGRGRGYLDVDFRTTSDKSLVDGLGMRTNDNS